MPHKKPTLRPEILTKPVQTPLKLKDEFNSIEIEKNTMKSFKEFENRQKKLENIPKITKSLVSKMQALYRTSTSMKEEELKDDYIEMQIMMSQQALKSFREDNTFYTDTNLKIGEILKFFESRIQKCNELFEERETFDEESGHYYL